jgi:hypothetical protein
MRSTKHFGFLKRLKQSIPFWPVNNDIRGLIDSVDDGSTSAFMWEWFTTKPFVDAGQARFVRRDVSRSFHSATPKTASLAA